MTPNRFLSKMHHWLRKPLSWCGLKQMCLPSNGRWWMPAVETLPWEMSIPANTWMPATLPCRREVSPVHGHWRRWMRAPMPICLDRGSICASSARWTDVSHRWETMHRHGISWRWSLSGHLTRRHVRGWPTASSISICKTKAVAIAPSSMAAGERQRRSKPFSTAMKPRATALSWMCLRHATTICAIMWERLGMAEPWWEATTGLAMTSTTMWCGSSLQPHVPIIWRESWVIWMMPSATSTWSGNEPT